MKGNINKTEKMINKNKIFKNKIIICKDEKATAIAVAKALIGVVKDKPNACLGLATGGTVIPVYEYMIHDHNVNKTDYSSVKTFNLDEYINLNPLYIHESYRAFMNFRLFIKINIKLANTHFPDQKSPSKYEKLINDNGGLDVQIISLGHNGHIAFNEPGSDINSITRVIELTQSTINANSRFFENKIAMVPKRAVSMGIKSILDARKIICIVTDVSKADAVKHMISGKYDPKWPCSSCIFHPHVEIYLDEKTAKVVGIKSNN